MKLEYILLLLYLQTLNFVNLSAQSDNCFIIEYTFINKLSNWPERKNNVQIFLDDSMQHSYISSEKRGYKTVGTVEEVVEGKIDEIVGYYPLYDTVPFILVKNYNDKSILLKEQEFGDRTGKAFTYTQESITDEKWEIIDSSIYIDSLQCFLAKINFRCRNYYAWFAPTAPVKCTPYKFPRLPGLVIELYSENKKFYYYYKSLNAVHCSKREDFPMPKEFDSEDLPHWSSKKSRYQKVTSRLKAKLPNIEFHPIECFSYNDE